MNLYDVVALHSTQIRRIEQDEIAHVRRVQTA